MASQAEKTAAETKRLAEMLRDKAEELAATTSGNDSGALSSEAQKAELEAQRAEMKAQQDQALADQAKTNAEETDKLRRELEEARQSKFILLLVLILAKNY